MDVLKDMFEQAHTCLAGLVEKTAQKMFLTEADFFDVMDVLTKLDREQKRCVLELALEDEEELTVAKIEEIQMIRKQRREMEEKIAQLRQVAKTFLSVRCRDENCRENLEAFQNCIAQCSDEKLLDMDQSRELDNYRQFNTFVVQEPEYSYMRNLTKYFDYPLVLALSGRQMFFSDEAVPTPHVSCEDEAPGDVGEENFERTEVVKIIQEELVEAEPVVKGDSVPGSEENDSDALTPPVSDLAPLGQVVSLRSKKVQGAKVFERLCKEPLMRFGSVYVLSQLYNLNAYSADMADLVGEPQRTYVKKFTDRLYKEGYLVRHTLEYCPGAVLYNLSDTGRSMIEKNVAQKLIQKKYGKYCGAEVHSAADFVRIYWGQYLYSRFDDANRDLFCSYAEGNKFSVVSIYLRENGPAEVLVLPAAIYTGNEERHALEPLNNVVREALKTRSDNMKIFLSAITKEEGTLWKEYLRKSAEIPEDIPVLYGLIGKDEYWDDQDNIHSLYAHIDQLRETRKNLEHRTVEEHTDSAKEKPIEGELSADVEEPAIVGEPAADEESVVTEVDILEKEPTSQKERRTEDKNKKIDRDGQNIDISSENRVEDVHQKMYQLFREKKYPSALTICRVLAREGEAFQQEYNYFAYAFDDPALEKTYRGSELQTVFADGFGKDGVVDALCLAAYMRMYFSQDAMMEPNYIHSSLETLNKNGLFDRFPLLKNILYDLNRCFERTKTTFHPETLSLLIDSKRADSLRIQYHTKVTKFLESRPEETQKWHRRIDATFKKLFGVRSEFRQAMEWVINEEENQIPEIRRMMDRFLLDPNSLSGVCTNTHLNMGRVEDYVICAWDESEDSTARYRNDNFKDPSRSTAINRAAEVVKLVMSWVSLGENGGNTRINEEKQSFLNAERKKIAEEMRVAAEHCLQMEFTEAEMAACTVLSTVLQELADCLTKGYATDEKKYLYLDFLRDNRVELDENYIPYLEEDFRDISPLNIYKRVFKHSCAQLPDWPEVIERNFEEPEEGCDFGHAELIQRYLKAVGSEYIWPDNYSFSNSVDAAQKRLEDEDRNFQARLDLGENYGWIDDPSHIDLILTDMEHRREHYQRTQNFGFYFRTAQAYLQELVREAQLRTAGYMKEMEGLRAEKGDWPIFEEITNLIEKQMYTVAQDYMDQARRGIMERPQSRYLGSGDNAFQYFLNQYDNLLRTARQAAEQNICEIYRRKTREHGIARSGETMLNNWPRSEGAATSDKLRSFFSCMGLPVSSVVRENGGQQSRYHVKFKLVETATDYAHPIGAYGTEMMTKGLDVFLVFGKRTDSTMNTQIQSLMTASVDRPAIILADMAIALTDRRSLAHRIKTQNLNLSPCLILDRVLLLHLAEYPQLDRWKLFLKCSLPFHYHNPYTESHTKELCPEMFIGRRDELRSIISPGGANIVYGGRQLGKTALLQRAQKLKHIEQEGQWAFYLEIKGRNVDEVASMIYEKIRVSFLEEQPGNTMEPIEWDVLTRKIIYRMNDGKKKVRSFLLLLDEADDFLRDCGEGDCGYKPIICFKRIQSETDRFKFVFAGLHKVLQFYNKATQDDDSPIPHLAPITMKPLPFDEARELMELPLSYLGFKIREEDVPLIAQVLSSTNYYPGLIQYYCSRLVQAVSRDTQSDINERPPYWLEEGKILALLKDSDFQNNIKQKFMITLGIDVKDSGYYRILAYALAYCYFEQGEFVEQGYTADDICNVCHNLDIRSITSLSRDQVEVLLNELIELNVLRSRERGMETRYIFNRPSFRHMLGDQYQVEDELEEIMLKEAE